MIKDNMQRLLRELPRAVILVGAAKTKTPQEMLQAIEGGLEILGHNYVQEAERAFEVIGSRAKWHMIGHLQSNKVKKAVKIFDMVETVDSLRLAKAIDKACERLEKVMPILIEVNSGEEAQKAGVLPSECASLIEALSKLEHIQVKGLMTMGPFSGDPGDARPYFQKTRQLFEEIKGMALPRVEMRYLSMGMSNSYKVALEEGANMVRIGTKIFGGRG